MIEEEEEEGKRFRAQVGSCVKQLDIQLARLMNGQGSKPRLVFTLASPLHTTLLSYNYN